MRLSIIKNNKNLGQSDKPNTTRSKRKQRNWDFAAVQKTWKKSPNSENSVIIELS